jgi:hypothetical protein
VSEAPREEARAASPLAGGDRKVIGRRKSASDLPQTSDSSPGAAAGDEGGGVVSDGERAPDDAGVEGILPPSEGAPDEAKARGAPISRVQISSPPSPRDTPPPSLRSARARSKSLANIRYPSAPGRGGGAENPLEEVPPLAIPAPRESSPPPTSGEATPPRALQRGDSQRVRVGLRAMSFRGEGDDLSPGQLAVATRSLSKSNLTPADSPRQRPQTHDSSSDVEAADEEVGAAFARAVGPPPRPSTVPELRVKGKGGVVFEEEGGVEVAKDSLAAAGDVARQGGGCWDGPRGWGGAVG